MGKIQLAVSSPYDELLHLTSAVSVSSRTWVRNGVGTAQVFVPRTTPRFTDIIAWGNILRLREDGLPPWVGVTVKREWDGHGMTLGLKSAEWLLGKKLTGPTRGIEPATVGALAADYFTNAAFYNNGLRNLKAGLFDAGGFVHRPAEYADLLELYGDLADSTGFDFWVDDRLQVHFRNLRGQDKASGQNPVVLREYRELVGVSVVEDADEVVTAGLGIGDGEDSTRRPLAPRQIPSSAFFRAEVFSYRDTSPERIASSVDGVLRERAAPRVSVDAEVVNHQPGHPWSLAFTIGDTVRLVIDHPEHRNLVARVSGLELGTEDKLRVVFSVVQPTLGVNPQPWTLV